MSVNLDQHSFYSSQSTEEIPNHEENDSTNNEPIIYKSNTPIQEQLIGEKTLLITHLGRISIDKHENSCYEIILPPFTLIRDGKLDKVQQHCNKELNLTALDDIIKNVFKARFPRK
jgi:hypothetical protein